MGTSYSYIPTNPAKATPAGKAKKGKGDEESTDEDAVDGEIKLGRGYDASRIFMRENPKIRDQIQKDVRKRMKEVVMSSSGE